MAGNVYTWSTTAATNAGADADINFAEGQLPGTVNDSVRGLMAGVAGLLKDNNATLTTGGSANVQTVTSNIAIAALATGLKLRVKAGFSNTSACTLNLTPSGGAAFGAKAIKIIKDSGEADPAPNQIRANGHYIFEYDAAANAAAGAWILLNPAPSSVATVTPQGRLTLQTGVPVMTTTQSAKTTIYYTPYKGRYVPIYDGAELVPTDIGGELSQATTDSTKSPAAVTTNSNYDLFVWNDSGTIRCTRGPAWSSDTARGTGAGTTELEMIQGIYLNKVAITNGPGADRGTYVGTVRSNGSSQIDWIYGVVGASGGTNAVFGVWNMYNRTHIVSFSGTSTDSWSYSVASWRQPNAESGPAASFISGLAEDGFTAEYGGNAAGATGCAVGVGFDATNAFSGRPGYTAISTPAVMVARHSAIAQGYHTFYALEYAQAGAVTFYGDSGAPTLVQTGLHFAGFL